MNNLFINLIRMAHDYWKLKKLWKIFASNGYVSEGYTLLKHPVPSRIYPHTCTSRPLLTCVEITLACTCFTRTCTDSTGYSNYFVDLTRDRARPCLRRNLCFHSWRERLRRTYVRTKERRNGQYPCPDLLIARLGGFARDP